ncbi:hypothetical protein D5S17_20080 [Pseudonocardiaceae bacterium YIM PH 21723]|nr:hypothetical protein D5S17_20080 [Pseudonocardiaceae bacterium YIM PH 21723]
MTFAIGFFDLFTYAIAGSLYLGLASYVAFRLHLLDPAAVQRMPVLLTAVIIVVASYLLGYLAYPIGNRLNQLLPGYHARVGRTEFLRRNPLAQGRPFLRANEALLLAGLELHDRETAAEAARQRAIGLMLRSSAPALLFGAVAAVVELIRWRHPLPAATCAVLLAAGAVTMITEGRKFTRWADMKILELCFWLPEIDEKLAESPPVGAVEDGR